MPLGTWDKSTTYPGETDQQGALISPQPTPGELPMPSDSGIIGEAIDNVQNTFAQNKKTAQDSFNRALARDPSGKNIANALIPASTIVGGAFGDIASVIGETVNVLTGGISNTVQKGVQKGVDLAMTAAGGAGAAAGSAVSPLVQAGISPEALKKTQKFLSQDNPDAMDIVHTIINTANVIMLAKGGADTASGIADRLSSPPKTDIAPPGGGGSGSVVDTTATDVPPPGSDAAAPEPTGTQATGAPAEPPPGSWQSMLKQAGGIATKLTSKVPTLNPITDAIGKATGNPTDAATIAARNSSLLTNLEENYPALKEIQDNALAKGQDVKGDIAKTNLLDGSITKGKRVLTTGADRAQAVFKAIINPFESVVRDALVKEGTTVPLTDVEAALTQEANTLPPGTAKVAALKAAKAAVAAYEATDANPDGTIDLVKIHDAKIAQGKTISDTNWTDGDAKAGAKAIYSGLQKLIEDNTKSIPVKEVNAALSRLYTMRSYLEELNNKVVENGKLGNHLRVLYGGLPGLALGGIPGAAASLLGELGMSKFTDYLSRSQLKGAGGDVPISDVLKSAVDKNNQPSPVKPTPLQLPAPDATKSGPTINMGAPTTYEAPAKIIGNTDTGVPKPARLLPTKAQVDQIWKGNADSGASSLTEKLNKATNKK